MDWKVRVIKKIFIYVSILLLVILISVTGNLELKDIIKTEKQSIVKLKTDYNRYFEEYLKLNEYVAKKDYYISEYNKINADLNAENILINIQ